MRTQVIHLLLLLLLLGLLLLLLPHTDTPQCFIHCHCQKTPRWRHHLLLLPPVPPQCDSVGEGGCVVVCSRRAVTAAACTAFYCNTHLSLKLEVWWRNAAGECTDTGPHCCCSCVLMCVCCCCVCVCVCMRHCASSCESPQKSHPSDLLPLYRVFQSTAQDPPLSFGF